MNLLFAGLLMVLATVIAAFALLCFASATLPRFGGPAPTPGLDLAVGTASLTLAGVLVFFAGRLV